MDIECLSWLPDWRPGRDILAGYSARENEGGVLLDLVHDAYLADPRVREFLLRENPAAARAIAERLDTARRHGLWHPRRNDIGADLLALPTEAAPTEVSPTKVAP